MLTTFMISLAKISPISTKMNLSMFKHFYIITLRYVTVSMRLKILQSSYGQNLSEFLAKDTMGICDNIINERKDYEFNQKETEAVIKEFSVLKDLDFYSAGINMCEKKATQTLASDTLFASKEHPLLLKICE